MKGNGAIVGWGDNTYWQCDIPVPNADFVAVAGGNWHSLGLNEGRWLDRGLGLKEVGGSVLVTASCY
ncbi:MAG: hypothetical protein KKB50_01955 [Planctomycetes bacterium]|nr:hypothetical protein [Planctomycetota bacterium]